MPESKGRCRSRPRWYLLLIVSACLGLILATVHNAQASYSLTLTLVPGDNPHFVGYKIYQRTADEKYDYRHPVWNGKGTNCIITGLKEGTDYYFVARTYDNRGNQSKNSNEIYYRQAAVVPPDPPPEPPPGPDPPPPAPPPDTPAQPDPEPSPPPGPNPADTLPDASGQPPVETVGLKPRLQIPSDQLPVDAANYCKTQWTVFRKDDDLCVLDITTDRFLAALDMPNLVLEENTIYYWQARFHATDGTMSTWTQPIEMLTGSSPADANGDGIPDLQEVKSFLDLDQNGAFDQEQEDLRSINTVLGAGQVSVSIAEAPKAFTLPGLESVDPLTITTNEDLPYDAPMGLINFRLLVSSVGDDAALTLYLSAPVPAGNDWYLADALYGWRDYSDNVELAADRQSLRLMVKDGGSGDGDGVANGIIVCQSGFGAPQTTRAASQTGGSKPLSEAMENACFIQALAQPGPASVWQRLGSLF